MAPGERALGPPSGMQATTPSDLVRLLQRVAENDRDAFRKLYDSTSAKLFGVVLRILKDRERSEDVLQETYVRIWDNAGRFDAGKASPITWMAAIARNRAIDEVRRRRPLISADETLLDRIADPTPQPDRQAAAREGVRRLSDCLGELEPPRDEMVRLAYLDGLSRDTLAARFDQPVGTVKTWLRRSLRQLQDCMNR